MSVQTSYSYATPRGVAGSLYDLSPYATISRLNGETGAALKFGMGVVRAADQNVKRPAAASTADSFAGLVLHFQTEQDMEGKISIPPNHAMSILSYGRAWARVGANAAPAEGAPAYLITDGEEAGCFTTSGDTAAKIAVKARFLGGKDSGRIAPLELYNQMNEAPAPTPGA